MLMNFGPSLTDSCTGLESLKQEFHCSHVHILLCNIQICSTDKQTNTHIRKRRNTQSYARKHTLNYTKTHVHIHTHNHTCMYVSTSASHMLSKMAAMCKSGRRKAAVLTYGDGDGMDISIYTEPGGRNLLEKINGQNV